MYIHVTFMVLIPYKCATGKYTEIKRQQREKEKEVEQNESGKINVGV